MLSLYGSKCWTFVKTRGSTYLPLQYILELLYVACNVYLSVITVCELLPIYFQILKKNNIFFSQ